MLLERESLLSSSGMRMVILPSFDRAHRLPRVPGPEDQRFGIRSMSMLLRAAEVIEEGSDQLPVIGPFSAYMSILCAMKYERQ